MGNGYQPGQMHALPRLRRRLPDRAFSAAGHDLAAACSAGNRHASQRALHPTRALQSVQGSPLRRRLPGRGDPTSARTASSIVDQNKCVGCRYCVIACPYQNRTFLSKDKDPGYFPGYEKTGFEKRAKSSTRTRSAPPRNATSAWRESTPAWPKV